MEIKNKKSLLQKIINFIARILSIKQKEKQHKKERETDDIYPLW